jgi:hypothetical protein
MQVSLEKKKKPKQLMEACVSASTLDYRLTEVREQDFLSLK